MILCASCLSQSQDLSSHHSDSLALVSVEALVQCAVSLSQVMQLTLLVLLHLEWLNHNFALLNIITLQDLQWHSSLIGLWYPYQHQYTSHSFSAFSKHETLHFDHVQELDHAVWRWKIDFCISHTLIRYENCLNNYSVIYVMFQIQILLLCLTFWVFLHDIALLLYVAEFTSQYYHLNHSLS